LASGSPGNRVNIGAALVPDRIRLEIDAGRLTNVAFKNLNAAVTTTNTVDVFDSPEGTAYQVPSAKKFTLFFLAIVTTAAGKLMGLVEGTDAQTNGVTVPANNNQQVRQTTWQAVAADVTFYPENVFVEVAADLYLHMYASATSGTMTAQGLGVEADA